MNPIRNFVQMAEYNTDEVIFDSIRFPEKWNLPAGSRIAEEDYLTESSIDERIDDFQERKRKKPRKKKAKKGKLQKNPDSVHKNKKEKNMKKKIIQDDSSEIEEVKP